MSQKIITVYVCPHPLCGNYYGSSSMTDLSQAHNIRTAMQNVHDKPQDWGKSTGTRDQCPDCRAAGWTAPGGEPIARIPVTVVVSVSMPPEPEPDLAA